MSSVPARAISLGTPDDTPGALATLALRDDPLSVPEALETASSLAKLAVSPGSGATRDLWEALATVAARDLGAARVIEPHLDALAILEQAGEPAPAAATWGVFAAEGGDDPLIATEAHGAWTLTGTKPWCSLADRLDRALVSARTADGDRRLFAVHLRDAGVSTDTSAWHARGLSEIPSAPVRFEAVDATAVGSPGWYLERPGFAWGGIGVAACWFGGAVGIARTVFAAASDPKAHPFLAVHLGAIDELLESSRRALAEAAILVDAGAATGPAGSLLAKRVRATVARAGEEILARSGHALGPAPLALDAAHAKRVADLQLYLRQHHAERDQASLGSALVKRGGMPW
jgi:alkylation response protein AidB-like acyl-CoA dehydrogenase